MRPPRNGGGGFTLVELVAVIAVMAILAAVALPRFLNRDAADARGFRDGTAAFLRYAHKLAIGRHAMAWVQADAAGLGLCATPAVPCAGSLPGPGGETPYRLAVPTGVTLTPSRAVLGFNARGQPTDAAAVPLAAATSYAVSGATAITVEAETGYVH